MSNLLQRRWRLLRHKVKYRIRDLRTFTHPGVKLAIVAILIIAALGAVIYALRSDPANQPPPGEPQSSSVPGYSAPPLGHLAVR